MVEYQKVSGTNDGLDPPGDLYQKVHLTNYKAYKHAATVIVATDGTGDYTTIQAGIDALPAAGGSVFIKEGTYTITTALSRAIDNVTLVGTGKATKIATTSNVNLIEVGAQSGWILADLYLYGAGSGNTSNNGIKFTTTTDSTIQRCWIDNCGDSGIRFATNSNRNTIHGNNVTASQSNGMVIFSGSYCLISDNTVYSNTTIGIHMRGATNGSEKSEHNTIVGNTVHSNVRDGIYLYAYANSNTVVGNTIRNNDVNNAATYDGIRIDTNCDYNVVTSNRCEDNDGYEINIVNSTCDENIIVGNQVEGADHVGTINDAGTNTRFDVSTPTKERRIEHGTTTGTVSGTGSGPTASITFGTAFSSEPTVVATLERQTGNYAGYPYLISVATTGFTMYTWIDSYTTEGTCVFNWVAIGED